MEHHLSFLPAPQTPPRCRFAVETLHPRSDSEPLINTYVFREQQVLVCASGNVSDCLTEQFLFWGSRLVTVVVSVSGWFRWLTLRCWTLCVSCLRRKRLWMPVAACSRLTAGQTCNLTQAFEDPFDQYRARVRGFVSNLTSHWTVSTWFQPLTDSERAQI